MKTIQISQRDFKRMHRLHNSFYGIYGNKDTTWGIDDLEEMRAIGQEFMDVFAINFKK